MIRLTTILARFAGGIGSGGTLAGGRSRARVSLRIAVEAGREAFLIGLGAPLDSASATSPLTAFLGTTG